MERTPVESSAIKSVGYDQQTHKLEIEFVAGTVYQYLDVPEDIYLSFIRAESKGSYFDHFIRNEGFVFTRLT